MNEPEILFTRSGARYARPNTAQRPRRRKGVSQARRISQRTTIPPQAVVEDIVEEEAPEKETVSPQIVIEQALQDEELFENSQLEENIPDQVQTEREMPAESQIPPLQDEILLDSLPNEAPSQPNARQQTASEQVLPHQAPQQDTPPRVEVPSQETTPEQNVPILPGSLVQRPDSPQPEVKVTEFDHLLAYDRLREAKVKIMKHYSNTNIEHTEAFEITVEARERLTKSREKKKVHKRVRAAIRHWDAPSRDQEKFNAEDVYHARIRGGSFDGGEEEEELEEQNPDDLAGDIGQEEGKGGDSDKEDNPLAIGEYNPDKYAVEEFKQYRFDHAAGMYVPDDDPDQEDDQWEWLTVSGAETPNSLFDEEVSEAKAAHKEAKTASSGLLWEEMRSIKMEEHRYTRMMAFLESQYPELRGYIVPRDNNKKRKAEPTDDFPFQPHQRSKRSHDIPSSKRDAVAQWHSWLPDLLKSHSTLEEFPFPITWPCKEHHVCWGNYYRNFDAQDEGTAKKRLLKACEHNIRDACSELTKRQLKKYMTWWHPDRFSAVRGLDWVERERWKIYAGEIFVVLNEMMEEKLVVGEGDEGFAAES